MYNHAKQLAPLTIRSGHLALNQFQHIFFGQRFEIEAIRRVVIGRDGLWVTIDHDGLNAQIRHGVGGVDTAIIELNPLPDPVRTSAEDDDLLTVTHTGFIFDLTVKARRFIGGIHIGRFRLEFRRAGIDAFIDGANARFVTRFADGFFRLARQLRNAGVRKAFGFNRAPLSGGLGQAGFF